jgi:hypothetical protein
MTAKQLPTKEWVKGIAHTAACLGITPRDICLSHGVEFDYFEGDSGLGEEEEAFFQTHSGRYFGLIRYPQANKTDYTAIFVDEKLKDLTDSLNEILCDMGWKSSDVIWLDLDRYRFIPCTLFREDDHGSRTTVGNFDCYPDAFFEKEKLERRGHKQSYSIEVGNPKPKGWTGKWQARI